MASRQSSCEDKQSTSESFIFHQRGGLCDFPLFLDDIIFIITAVLQQRCTWIFNGPLMSDRSQHETNVRKPKKLSFHQTDEPFNVADSMPEISVKEGKEQDRGGRVINNTGEVCNQTGEGRPALRKADPPSSQAYSCHSTLTYKHRAREQVGFKRNKLPKYGSERAFEKSSIGKR